MSRWQCGSILLILAVAHASAETVKKDEVELISTLENQERGDRGILIQTDSGKLDYETALRPAVLQKRSIANIARLLLGGNVPPNHPLVKYPEPKTWNLASNIMAALPGAQSALQGAASTGWGQPADPKPTALQNIQQLFETKAKLIPYTGQVATGLTGMASVKGDLIRQIHSISTQAIAQAAAEAAARALASAAAAHAVTNSISNVVSPAQAGIKGGWSSYQNFYDSGKVPSDQPGPPYSSSSAHINQYHAVPGGGYQRNNIINPFSAPVTTPAPPSYTNPTIQSPLSQQNYGGGDPYQNGYYTLYNTQQQPQRQQTPSYTPPPPVGHARPTISPHTLIATTPSGYNPSLISAPPSSSFSSSSRSSSLSSPVTSPANTIPNSSADTTTNPSDDSSRGSRTLVTPPVVIFTGKSRPNNVTPLTSFRRAVPAGIFGRHAAQPASTSSLLSTISNLLGASTAAYNAAFTGGPPAAGGSAALFPNLLPAPSGPQGSGTSLSSPSLSSSAFAYAHQGGSPNGGHPGSGAPGLLHNYPAPAVFSSASEARPSSLHAPGYHGGQHGASYAGASYAQSGANSYSPAGIQSSPFLGPNPGSSGPGSYSSSGGAASSGGGSGQHPSFSTGSGGGGGSGYPGNYAGSGSSVGPVGGWNTVHAGSPFGQAAWSSGGSGAFSNAPGYSGATPGNFNNPPGSYGAAAGSTNYVEVASNPALAQQAYPAIPQNAYQSPATHAYAPAQQFAGPASAGNYGGRGNSYLNSYQQRQDQSLSASTMGNNEDYDDDLIDTDTLNHSYQQEAQRRNTVKPSNHKSKNDAYSNSRYSPKKKPTSYHNHHHHQQNKKNGGDRVLPTGNKKGSHIDSQVDVVANVDDYLRDDEHSSDEYDDDDKHVDAKQVQPVSTKHRWRSQNSPGQRPNPLHDHHSHGGWRGKASHASQAPSKNVRGRGRRPEGTRPQPGRQRGQRPPPSLSQAPKKTKPDKRPPPAKNGKGAPPKKKWTQQQHRQKSKVREEQKTSSTSDKHLRGGSGGGGGGAGQFQTSPEFKSRDVYTTLPEYVFRVDERPDVFLRPAGKRTKPRNPFWRGGSGFLGRAGETDGRGGSRAGSQTSPAATQHAPHSLSNGRAAQKGDLEAETETSGEALLGEEAWALPVMDQNSSKGRQVSGPTSGRGEAEEFTETRETPDETARADSVEEQQGFITSEEFDPEEREAFVDDVYADDHLHLNRRNDNQDEDDDDNNTEDDRQADLIDKKR